MYEKEHTRTRHTHNQIHKKHNELINLEQFATVAESFAFCCFFSSSQRESSNSTSSI